jgi:hypothetical protein
MVDMSIYTDGARLERELRQLKPGQNFRVPVMDLRRVVVPANPMDNQTPEYLARWFHARMPFYCTLHADPLGAFWEIRRPATPVFQS